MICVFHYTCFTYKKAVFESQTENIYTHKQYIFMYEKFKYINTTKIFYSKYYIICPEL